MQNILQLQKAQNALRFWVAGVITMLTLAIGLSASAGAVVDAVTPSTNEQNKAKGWAYVEQTSNSVGSTELTFNSTRNLFSCFEYRTDGDTSQVLAQNGGNNYNPAVTDGLYPYVCVSNETKTVTLNADSYVEVRMVFGAETDERFDWTRFDLLYNRTAEITAPAAGADVYGTVEFAAYLNDNDVDAVQWAVREGTCQQSTNTVFGNVDGKNDTATIDTSDLANQTFSFSADMSGMTPGMYCFVYNPVEDSGEQNIRLTREFNLLAPLNDKAVCKKDGWMSYGMFKNQGDCVSYVATGGKNAPAGN